MSPVRVGRLNEHQRGGTSDPHITRVNADGVLFAVVRDLSENFEEKEARIDEFEDRLATLGPEIGPADD